MKCKLSSIIEEQAIKNLLSAHKRIAENGSAKDAIRISKYILKISKKVGDVLIDVGAESDQDRRCDPINNLDNFE